MNYGHVGLTRAKVCGSMREKRCVCASTACELVRLYDTESVLQRV